jgi:predicted amidohydrolase YtcJ
MESLHLHDYTYIIGNIYTADKTNSFIEALLIHKNKIEICGSILECHEYIEKQSIAFQRIKTIKLTEKQLALPGFIDSHCHPLLGGMQSAGAKLFDIDDVETFKLKLKSYIDDHPELDFIMAFGYHDKIFGSSSAHYSILDEICMDRPIVVLRWDAHAYWVNSKTIEVAGITKDSVSPNGGLIEKDKNGELTGVFHDDAMTLIKKFIPSLSAELKYSILQETMQYMASLGIVCFMDAAVKYKNYELFNKLYSCPEMINKLPRAALSISFSTPFFDPDNETKKSVSVNLENTKGFFQEHRIQTWDDFYAKNKLKINTVKLFIDGVFESGTAMVSNCNCHNDGYSFTDEELQEIVDYLYSNEIQIHSHCIGDLAITKVLNCIEKAKEKFKNIPNKARNYIAHLQLVNDKDFPRFKELDVYSSFSPYWFQKDTFSETVENLVGKERVKNIYPIKSLIDSGAKVAFGSDWPVSTPNPLDGIEVAVTHKALSLSFEKPAYLPEQQISLIEAVRAYTIDSAEILGLENEIGSIETGKLADIIILDTNIFKIEECDIHTAKVLMTMIDGVIIYDSGKLTIKI